jgi:hypothetical protein
MYGSVSVDSTYIKAHRSTAGAKRSSITPSAGGQTTKIHALTDQMGRPGRPVDHDRERFTAERVRSLLTMGISPGDFSLIAPTMPEA